MNPQDKQKWLMGVKDKAKLQLALFTITTSAIPIQLYSKYRNAMLESVYHVSSIIRQHINKKR